MEMSRVKLDEEAKQLALAAIGTDILFELRCEHCGRFFGYYNTKDPGNGIILYCKWCKGFTIKAGEVLDKV